MCLFTFVGASRGHLCDRTAFLYFVRGVYEIIPLGRASWTISLNVYLPILTDNYSPWPNEPVSEHGLPGNESQHHRSTSRVRIRLWLIVDWRPWYNSTFSTATSSIRGALARQVSWRVVHCLTNRYSRLAHYFALFWGLGLCFGYLGTSGAKYDVIFILARRPRFPTKATKFRVYLA